MIITRDLRAYFFDYLTLQLSDGVSPTIALANTVRSCAYVFFPDSYQKKDVGTNNMDASFVIRTLLDVLPDTDSKTDVCWEWCWNELGDDAQEEVKAARKIANDWLHENQEVE